MLVLGIDIGLVNYAISCIEWINQNEWKVVYANIHDTKLKKTSTVIQITAGIKAMFDNLLKIKDKDGNVFKFDYIVIEKQPGKRLIMERIYSATIAYFMYFYPLIPIKPTIKKFDILSLDSTILSSLKGKKNYKNRKNFSVMVGKYCLCLQSNKYCKENTGICQWIDISFAKQDDVYDSILLILSHFKCKFL